MGQTRFLIVTRPARGGTDGAGAPRTVWRLLGANNRELGRCLTDFPDQESCRQAVTFLCENIERANPLIMRAQPATLWVWRLEVDEVPLALSARAYRRQRECLYNLALFRAAVLNTDTTKVLPHLVRTTLRNRVELAAQ
ncbi:hypothetical protein [Streptacidiphilus sp. EB129]|uniref:hypothetical protein n=1 Tax=Streptacidiphilus sp. EB129 TaxID=3156262 RepID=UPI003513B0A4